MVPAEDRIARTTGIDSVKPICLLISGGAGTGKSTIAKLSTYFLRERIGETAALSTDEFYRMFDPHWTSTNRDWWRRAWEHCLASAKWLFQNGVRVVVMEGNGFYSREQVNDVLKAVDSLATVYHVTLAATLEVATERVRQRGDLERHPPDFVSGWLEFIKKHHYSWTHVIDNSTQTTEETLEEVFQHITTAPGLPTELLPDR
jgi:adenylylsulfate kinase-like enzyme